MSKTVEITSVAQFSSLLNSSRVVVADFYADWCGPCKAVAPIYEQLSKQLSRQNVITFTKINTDSQTEIAGTYKITAMPTFIIFKNGREVSRTLGANGQALSEAVKKLAAEANSDGSSSAGGFGESSGTSSGDNWCGASFPRGYRDITSEINIRGVDLLNSDSEFGTVKTLFDTTAPSTLDPKGKGKATGAESKRDWVESDTDEQLMLFVPFNATLKIHTIQLTSLPPYSDDDEAPMRPKTIHLYTNRAHILGFEEAEDTTATQKIELSPSDWDEKTGTAKVELRFVKFQNVTSLVMFIVDGEGDGERVRLDRVRIIGESGEKRELGKLEKITDE